MKHPSNRLANHRRIDFDADFDIREDDLLLADVSVTKDDIDRLLIDTGFDTDITRPDLRTDPFVIIEDLKPDAKTPTFDSYEIPLAEPVADNLPPPTTTTNVQADSIISPYLAMRPMPQVGPETESNSTHSNLEAGSASPKAIVLEPAALNITEKPDNQEKYVEIEKPRGTAHFINDFTETTSQDDLTAEPKDAVKPQRHYQPKSTINYIILAIACASLLSTLLLGMIVYGMKTEVTKLTALLAIVREDLEINTPQDLGPTDKRTGKPFE